MATVHAASSEFAGYVGFGASDKFPITQCVRQLRLLGVGVAVGVELAGGYVSDPQLTKYGLPGVNKPHPKIQLED